MECNNKLCKYNDDYYRDNCSNTLHAELASQCMKNNFNHYDPADLAQPGASAERISSVVRSANKTRLIKIAVELLTSVQLSDCGEDYKFKMPKYILRQIEKQNDRLREIAIELKEISDRTK